MIREKGRKRNLIEFWKVQHLFSHLQLPITLSLRNLHLRGEYVALTGRSYRTGITFDLPWEVFAKQPRQKARATPGMLVRRANGDGMGDEIVRAEVDDEEATDEGRDI